jgi:hypothetical protein
MLPKLRLVSLGKETIEMGACKGSKIILAEFDPKDSSVSFIKKSKNSN